MPLTLDLSPNNRAVYAGCKVTMLEGNRHRIDTPLDSVVAIAAQNILEIVKAVPSDERDELVLTGSAPTPIYLTAMSVAGPLFKRVIQYDGRQRVKTEIPSPPPDFRIEREDEEE